MACRLHRGPATLFCPSLTAAHLGWVLVELTHKQVGSANLGVLPVWLCVRGDAGRSSLSFNQPHSDAADSAGRRMPAVRGAPPAQGVLGDAAGSGVSNPSSAPCGHAAHHIGRLLYCLRLSLMQGPFKFPRIGPRCPLPSPWTCCPPPPTLSWPASRGPAAAAGQVMSAAGWHSRAVHTSTHCPA